MEKIKTKTKHGMTKTKEYRAWADMKNRCYNENVKEYKNYGQRGIGVSLEWFYSFEKFLSDIGACPSGDYVLDRIDPNGGYCKENCRWVNKSISSLNKNVKGYTKNKLGKFVSKINVCGKSYHIGCYETESEARFEYLKVRMEWYGI